MECRGEVEPCVECRGGENLACEQEISNPCNSYVVIGASICVCCLAVSRLCHPPACVFALASHFLTKKSSKFGCRNAGSGLLAESGPVELGRCLSTNLEVMNW